MQMMQGDGATKDNAAFEEAGKCTTEATMNVQTVASLGRETTFIQKYKTQESFFRIDNYYVTYTLLYF